MMMGRARSRSRAGWPANLYPNKGGFKYRHPVTKRESWMGMDRAKAFAAAKKLNAILMDGADLVSKVTGGKLVNDAIAVFRADDMPTRKWSAVTAAGYEIILKRIERGLGSSELETLAVKDCAIFIRGETESTRSRQQIRMVLGWVLACGVEEGWLETNPAAATRKFNYERKRARLTLDVYRAIWGASPSWLQNAMDLSLLTLLRREDIVSVRFEDARENALWVVPTKTEGSTGVRLKIAMSHDLRTLLALCRDDIASPYVIHRLPDRARPVAKRAKSRVHHTQVLPEQLSRAFADARDAAKIAGDNPVTFHEIRSLGGALLKEQGWTLQQVQQLMGHASEAMTEHYLEGHEMPWTPVAPGLSLPR